MTTRWIMAGMAAGSLLGALVASAPAHAAEEAAGAVRSPGIIVRDIEAISAQPAPSPEVPPLSVFGPVSTGRFSGDAVDGRLTDAELFSDEGPVRWLERYTREGLSVERTHELMQQLFGNTAGVRVEPPAFVL